MAIERLDSSDKRLILAVVLISVCSIGYTLLNYQKAFPQASLDLRLSKAEITDRAEKFLRTQGLSPGGFRQLTLFDPDDQARVYLERELGLEEANRLMQGPVAVWRWRARWFRPPDEEEMLVYLNPAGVMVGFSHIIPEAAPGARLTMEAARRSAEDFLAERTPAAHRLIEEQLQQRPSRDDYVFTWEQTGFRAKDATYRRTIVMQGDKIGRYSEYLYVPEKWQRDFATLRSSNDLYSQIASVVYVFLILAAIAVLIQALRRRRVLWRPLLIASAAVGLLMVISEWNSLPFSIDSMPTSSPYAQSILRALLLGLGAGMGVFLYIIVAAAPGETLYRASQPQHLSLKALTSFKTIRSKEFFVACVVGYGFAALHIAYVVAFYLIGRRFGVWSPQDVSYSDFLSTRLPWIYPLTISLMASTSEEFWFRLLAIPLLKRFLRPTWLAVLIPAFLWGFLHANYPQQPGYIRGIEVGIIGVAAGFLMLRFGIFTTLIWHYTVDAVMIGMFLFQADSWYFRLSGWLVGGAVAIPLLVSVVYYLKNGSFQPAPELLNSAQEPPAEAPPAEQEPQPVSARPVWPVKWLYIAAAILGLAALAAPRVAPFGDFIRMRVSRTGAEAAAAVELRSRGVNPDVWRRVALFQSRLSEADFEYLRRVQGRRADATVRDYTDTGLWLVRYFQPLRKEEWRVYVDQQRRVVRVDHLLDEKAPGARLTVDEAMQRAERFLRDEKGISTDRYRLVDSETNQRAQRTDHNFVWEDSSFRVADARARVSVAVVGDEVTSFQRFLKLPDEWLREFEKPRLTALVLPAALGAGGVLLVIILILRLSGRSHRYHWPVYVMLGAAGAAVRLILEINQWPVALGGYATTVPLASYLSSLILTRLAAAVALGFLFFLAALAADVFLQPGCQSGQGTGETLRRAFAVCLVIAGAARLSALIDRAIPGPHLSLPLWQLPASGAFLPGLEVAGQAVLFAGLALCALVVCITAALRYLRPTGRMVLVALAAAVYVSERNPMNVAQGVWYLAAALIAAAILWAVIRICGTDLNTYALALFWLAAAGPVITLIEQPEPGIRWNGIGAALLAIAVGLLFARWRSRAVAQ